MVPLPELRLLRTFVTVVDEGSLGRAGHRLHLSQQSVSQQILNLERSVGATLLVRSPRGVTPTAVGKVLVDEASAVLAEAERAMDRVHRSARGESGALHVGFLSSLANEFVPPVVRAMAERHPAIELHTDDLSIAALVAAVRAGHLDAAITRPPLVDDLRSVEIGSEPVVIALPSRHRLAGATSIRLADLAGERWVLTPRSSWPPWHQKYDQEFAAAGFVPNVVRRSATPQGLLALVAAGVGITRLAASARSLRAGGVSYVDLEGERASTVLVTRPGAAHPAMDALARIAVEVASVIGHPWTPDRDRPDLRSLAPQSMPRPGAAAHERGGQRPSRAT
jgi:DNA-binding transcriptional LysR family regulator